MTDAHCHVRRGESRHILCEPCDVASAAPGDAVFFGFHPWHLDGFDSNLSFVLASADFPGPSPAKYRRHDRA